MAAHLRLVDDNEPPPRTPYEDIDDPATAGQARARAVGHEFKHIARDLLTAAGATFHSDRRGYGAYSPLGMVCGRSGQMIIVLAHGVLDDTPQGGLRRTDTLKKAGFDAMQLKRQTGLPILLIASHLPDGGSARSQLADCSPDFLDVIATSGDFEGLRRLGRYLHDQPFPGPLPAPWRTRPKIPPAPTLFADFDTPGEEEY